MCLSFFLQIEIMHYDGIVHSLYTAHFFPNYLECRWNDPMGTTDFTWNFKKEVTLFGNFYEINLKLQKQINFIRLGSKEEEERYTPN